MHFQPYSETKIVLSVLDNLCNINLVSVSGEDIELTTFHQKLSHARPKSGGYSTFHSKNGGGTRTTHILGICLDHTFRLRLSLSELAQRMATK